MMIRARSSGTLSVSALFASTGGATAIEYIIVLGFVALTGAVAFGKFGDRLRSAVQDETKALAASSGEADGPIGSLAEEVAVAGAEELAVAGPWALADRAGAKGAAAARRKQRGRVASNFESEQSNRGSPAAGSCRNGVCSQEDGENCFVAGTPVATPNGPMPIERLEPGDLVLSRDQVTGNFSTQRVSATFITLDRELTDVHTVAMSGEEATLRVTPGHLFWTPANAWVPADHLAYGDVLTDTNGVEVGVVSVEPIRDRATVYNLEVEGTHTYFAGETPVWVHNGNCGSKRNKDNQNQTQNLPTQNPPTQNPPTQNPPTQNPPTQNPPTQNPPTQNPPTQNPQNPPHENPPGQSQPSSNTYEKQQVVDYINRTIAVENGNLEESYKRKKQVATDNGKTVEQWNTMIDKQIENVNNKIGEYMDYDKAESRQEIERLNDMKIPGSAPQIDSISSLDGAATAKTKSCSNVKCTDFGGTLFTQAGGTDQSPPHVGPIQANQLVNVSLMFPDNADSNNHVYSVYYDNTGNAYIIQSYVGHEVPIVSKMTQKEYEQLDALVRSGESGWKDAYQKLFGVAPLDSGAPQVRITDPS